MEDEAGEPLFVGKDVCEALGYANPNKAMGDHCKGITIRYPLMTAGGMQNVRVLIEPDVMRLVVSCTLPEGRRFEAWVFEEVLPPIRKTGAYAVVPFEFESKAVRVVKDEHGEPLFVGKDVCEALCYADPSTAIRSHCRGVQKLHPIPDALGRMQKVRVRTEPDVMRLVIRSLKTQSLAIARLRPLPLNTGIHTLGVKQQMSTVSDPGRCLEILACRWPPKANDVAGDGHDVISMCVRFQPTYPSEIHLSWIWR